VSELFAPVCSIAPTKRRRFLWAAWWSGPPVREPFRKPDAYSGGARTREEALAEAEKACGAKLVEIDASWARAHARVMRGEVAFPQKPRASSEGEREGEGERVGKVPNKPDENLSVWHVLGLAPNATPTDVKRAYRLRALETHPDRGGSPEAFREVQRAYETALERAQKREARPKKKR
jgi:hypothetical protein